MLLFCQPQRKLCRLPFEVLTLIELKSVCTYTIYFHSQWTIPVYKNICIVEKCFISCMEYMNVTKVKQLFCLDLSSNFFSQTKTSRWANFVGLIKVLKHQQRGAAVIVANLFASMRLVSYSARYVMHCYCIRICFFKSGVRVYWVWQTSRSRSSKFLNI